MSGAQGRGFERTEGEGLRGRIVTRVVGRSNSTQARSEWHCVDPEGQEAGISLSVGLACMRRLLMEGSTRLSGRGSWQEGVTDSEVRECRKCCKV